MVGALRTRMIYELKDLFSRHPIYQKIVPNIQGRFSFSERPEMGIVVKSSGGSKVQLDASNYMGTIVSHVMLAQLGQAVFPLEWVREDLESIRSFGSMPTLPGIYYLEILSIPEDDGSPGQFVIDPLITTTDQVVVVFTTGFETEGQLQDEPLATTLRLYENRRYLLTEGVDYTLGTKGKIKFLRQFPKTSIITADYRTPRESLGPYPFNYNRSNTTVLPGVVLAFGKRAAVGDKVAVVVYDERVDVAEAFGGKFEINFDLDVIARDTIQSEEAADFLVISMWSEKKPLLEWEGIEIVDISPGGDSEEAIDETGQNFSYTVSVSMQLRADWEVHVPLPLVISKIAPDTEQVSSSLFFQTYPIIAGRNPDYERIT